VWLTVHRNSVWIRIQLDVTYVLSFISTSQVAQRVSGNHVPIFRSWRLRGVIATCWYCAFAEFMVVYNDAKTIYTVNFVTSNFVVITAGATEIPAPTYHNSTHATRCVSVLASLYTTISSAKAQYQHVAITPHSRQLLKMGTWLPETCWATCKVEIKDNI